MRTDNDGGQACETDRKRRPDLLFLLRHPETSRITHALNVEIDEHSHEDRDVECELSRPDDIAESINALAQEEFRSRHARVDWKSNVPITLTLRFNPNAFDGKKAVRLEERVKVLSSFCSSFLRSRPGRDEYDPLLPHVKCFFSSKQGGSTSPPCRGRTKKKLFFHGNVAD